jgi:hypothetical protein
MNNQVGEPLPEQPAMIQRDDFRSPAARSRASAFTALFLLAGWLAVLLPLRSDTPPAFVLSIDVNSVPGGIFSPASVALDTSNNIYVTDVGLRVKPTTWLSRCSFTVSAASLGSRQGLQRG